MKSYTSRRTQFLVQATLWTLMMYFYMATAAPNVQGDYFEATEANEYDDRTLLDTFGQAAKEFLTKKVIPDTDAECKWDWRYARCEPFCSCDFIFKKGDYHLGRSCRRRVDEDETCNPFAPPPLAGPQLAIQRVVQGTQKITRAVRHKVKSSYFKLQSRVCHQLPDNLHCPEDENDDFVLLAWQEKLLCRNQIPECLLKKPRRPKADSMIRTEEG